jgi:hypothetical protein
MSKHDIRPRVLSAAYELRTFTVAELQDAAHLENRAQADFQIAHLTSQGYLEKETLPPQGKRGIKLYRLTANEERRQELSEVVARMQIRPRPSAALSNAAIQMAERSLERAESDLRELEKSDVSEFEIKLAPVNRLLEDAKTNLGTALLELGGEVSEEKTPDHPAILAALRWRTLIAERDRLGSKVSEAKEQRTVIGQYAVHAAKAVARAAFGAVLAELVVPYVWRSINKLPQTALRDVIRDQFEGTTIDVGLGVLIDIVCKTGDPTVASEVFSALKKIDLPWWKYNEQCYRYLINNTGFEAAVESLEQLYRNAERQIDLSGAKTGVLGTYVCEPGQLTEKIYVDLAKDLRLAIISPQVVPYLGFSEGLDPTLLAGSGLTDAVNASFLKPERRLRAYGFLNRTLRYWQGPPDVRVVGCLSGLGMKFDRRTVGRIGHQLAESRELIVAHDPKISDPAILTRCITEKLAAQEVAAIKLG